MMIKYLIVGFLLLCVACCPCNAETSNDITWDSFLHALHMKEASGKLNPLDGDGGKAIGPYQIWKSYWIDAKDYDKSLVSNGQTYQSCRNKDYAERVIKAYMKRWDRKSWTGVQPSWESKARLHNGGCNIYKKRGKLPWHNTTKYWNKLQTHLRQGNRVNHE